MKRSHFGSSILYHLNKHERSQSGLADTTGVTQSSLSRLIAGTQRPEISTLRALCTCWPDPQTNLRVLIEHLRDEMVRAGHSAEGEIDFRPLDHGQDKIDRTLATLTAAARTDADVAAILADLAHLVRRAHRATYPVSEEGRTTTGAEHLRAADK